MAAVTYCCLFLPSEAPGTLNQPCLRQMWIQDIPSESSIDDWTKTQWREINVEQMDVQLRRFAKAGPTAIYLCNLSVSVPPLPHSSHPLGCFIALQKKIPMGHEKYEVKITKTPQTICRILQLCLTDSTVVEYKVLNLTGQAFSSRRSSQTCWDSSFIKVEDEVQIVVVNAVQELSTEKLMVTDITDKENVMEATRKPKV
ncbi:dynein heavy chain 11, axonemal [Passer montanus]|uniref:dynein heavy chain 11, axonemal n=1 Tax=Passer montanus TaxID=9160 RepID=UPI0019600973|nr:dynein heavy chain 11, axonemal [Passer montanus]